jgi:inner membrane protein YidH
MMRRVTQPDAEAPGDAADEQTRDAMRRTQLANERTYLAWWRTGLTCLAVSFGTGKLVPSLSHGTQWPYTVLGAGFAIIGLVFIAYAFMRQQAVHRAVMRRDFEQLDDRFLAFLTIFGVVLGAAVLALVVVQP